MAPFGRIKTLSVLKQMLAINGLRWTTCVVPYVLIRKMFENFQMPFWDRQIKRMEEKHNLPGINCSELNYVIWQAWDWSSGGGEEWTHSQEWKESLVKHVLLKYIEPQKSVLEIGPGAGRWTETLQRISRDLSIVDLSPKCIEICQKRFSDCDNISYFVTAGTNLDFLKPGAIDFIWSYDVFVHIDPQDIEQYILEFKRVLKRGGIGIVHHAKDGGLHGGWRSRMTEKWFAALLAKYNMTLLDQFDAWGPYNRFDVKYYHDIFSIFEKPIDADE